MLHNHLKRDRTRRGDKPVMVPLYESLARIDLPPCTCTVRVERGVLYDAINPSCRRHWNGNTSDAFPRSTLLAGSGINGRTSARRSATE
jgi:hypothetical protein